MSQSLTGPMKTTVVPISSGESLTNLHGLVYGVVEGDFGAYVYYFGLERKVDWLSAQFKAALVSGKSFPFVKIQTPSGHVVSFLGGSVCEITKAGHMPSMFAGPYVAAGMEVITWLGPGLVAVDYVVVPTSYDWLGLNS